jgi:spore coat protein U-like protein
VVVEGPFNFGDITSSDRCNALKIPIAYTGPNLYLVSDGATVSTTDLAIVNCPGNLTVCGTPAYPANITATGGCGAANITFNPPASALPFGTSTVTATATDVAGNFATPCQFTVTRPYLTLGSSGFASPIGGTGGSCTVPLRQVKGAGNNLPIKFSIYSCNSIYNPTTPPTVTIAKLDPSTCQPTVIEISQQQLALTSSQWHWQWQTLPTDVGYFQISVNLGDGNPNSPSAIVQLTP